MKKYKNSKYLDFNVNDLILINLEINVLTKEYLFCKLYDYFYINLKKKISLLNLKKIIMIKY